MEFSLRDIVAILQSGGAYGLVAVIGFAWYYERQRNDTMWRDQLALAREQVAIQVRTEAAIEALTDALERRRA